MQRLRAHNRLTECRTTSPARRDVRQRPHATRLPRQAFVVSAQEPRTAQLDGRRRSTGDEAPPRALTSSARPPRRVASAVRRGLTLLLCFLFACRSHRLGLAPVGKVPIQGTVCVLCPSTQTRVRLRAQQAQRAACHARSMPQRAQHATMTGPPSALLPAARPRGDLLPTLYHPNVRDRL